MNECRVVPIPVASGRNLGEAVEALRSAVQREIQAQMDQGWRFAGQVDSTTRENPGCFSLGQPRVVPITMLVFERGAPQLPGGR